MIEAESRSLRRTWLPAWRRIVRALRSPILRALLGVQLIFALLVLLRAYGWLQPMELTIYDALRVAWSGAAPSGEVFLIGMTEPDIQRWHYPLSDDFLAELLERLASWHPRAIGVDIYRDMPVAPSSGKLEMLL